MPTAPRPACLEPRCPGRAMHRGYCDAHRRSEAQRGYGAGHRRDRVASRPGASCERCGCTENLQRDHRVPVSLGGGEDPGNKRWLCRCPAHGCHDAVGLRSSTRVGRPAPVMVLRAGPGTLAGGEGSRRASGRAIGHPGAASYARPGIADPVTGRVRP